jgi:predicted nucleic acid-binding protein
VHLVFDDRILGEYREVLARPELALDPSDASEVLELIERSGEHVSGVRPWPRKLPDADDAAFLEVAAAAGADALVTGNVRHFPADRRQGVRVITPASLVRMLSEG